nr:MAG TPA: hypothetical protein [Caudoviricetes sp.]
MEDSSIFGLKTMKKTQSKLSLNQPIIRLDTLRKNI